MSLYYLWLFSSAHRGILNVQATRFEKSKDPAEFRSTIKLFAVGGIFLTAVFIYLFATVPAQP